MVTLKGLKGGGQSTPHSVGDTLFSDDLLEIILGVSEGPIKGPKQGLRSIFLNGTPLVDSSGVPTISSFDVHFHKGQNPAVPIVPNLGGIGSVTQVGVNMETDTPIVRTGQHTDIDFIAFRIIINRLVYQHPQYGEAIAGCTWKIELKPHSATTWVPAGSIEIPPETSDEYVTRYFELHSSANKHNNPEARDCFIQATAPLAAEVTEANSLWFNSASSPLYSPKIWNKTTSAWDVPTSLTHTSDNGQGYAYWQWSEAGAQRRCYVGFQTTPPNDMAQYDLWLTPTGVLNNSEDTVYSWNGSSFSNGYKYSNPIISTTGDFTVIGKTTSPYVKECMVRVARINEPYDMRVTRTSPPSNAYYLCDMSYESFGEVQASTLELDDLSVLHLTVRASDQLSGMPKLTSDMEGRVIRVPSNYNPTTRVYTGVWDGTWKLEYSNNPAFIVNDLVSNDRYGATAYQPVTLDKWAVYAFGQHCDLHGFTYNELIQEPRSIEDACDYICGIAGGRYIDLGNGFSTILFDAEDQPAVALFTQENVTDGVFAYSRTDVNTRVNDITVSYVNPDYNWAEDRRRIFDAESIAQFGRIPEEFIAAGCIDEAEAVRRARLRLITAKTECAMVSFRTNRQGMYLSRFDIILVADPDSEFGLSGRIKEVTGARTVSLRDAIYFEDGLTYTMHIVKEDGTLFTTDLVTTSGSTKTLTTTTDLPALPEKATFAIGCAEVVGVPKAFRITSIDLDPDPDKVAISAMEVNRTKWDFVDAEVELVSKRRSGFESKEITPISNLAIVPRINSQGQEEAQLSWSASTSKVLRLYRIYQSIGGNPTTIIGETRDTSFITPALTPSSYQWTVVAVSLEGAESAAVSIEHTVSGVARIVLPATYLRLKQTATSEFYDLSPSLQWDASPDPYLSHYRVRVYNSGGSTPVFELTTKSLEFTYDYGTNATNHSGTAARSIQVQVCAVDTTGTPSQPVVLNIQNSQPQPPTSVTVTTDLFRMVIAAQKPILSDWAGMKVHVSTTDGFTPAPENLIYDGPNSSCETTIDDGQVKYVRVAFYDTFDKTVIGYSSQFSATGTGLIPGTVSFEKLTEDLQTTIETTEAAVVTQQTKITNLENEQYGSWSVKIQTQPKEGGGGYKVVSGFGLSQATHDGETTSDFVVAADRFSIIPPYNEAVPTTAAPVFIVGTKNGVASVGIKGDMYLDGTIVGAAIADATITGGKIANATITGAKIVDATITGAKIADATIDSAKIADASITSAKIGALQVKSANIEDLTVGGTKITANAVSNSVGAQAPTNTYVQTYFTIRANARIAIIATNNGGNTGSSSVNIKVNGTLVAITTGIALTDGVNYYSCSNTAVYTDTYATAQTLNIEVTGASLGVAVIAMELSK